MKSRSSKPASNDLIFGRHPVLDALRNGSAIDKILLQQGTRGDFERELRQLTKAANVPIQTLPRERLDRTVRGNHQGVIGFLSPLPYYRLEDVLPNIYEAGQIPLILILDGVTDVRNFGAIARSAEVLGAQALVIPRKNSAALNADAIKTSAGALTRISVCRERNVVSAVEWLQQNGVSVYASSLHESLPLSKLDFTGPAAIVLGSEDKGISRATQRAADATFIIPQLGQTDSLNVSVAAGICLYEVLRQRRAEFS